MLWHVSQFARDSDRKVLTPGWWVTIGGKWILSLVYNRNARVAIPGVRVNEKDGLSVKLAAYQETIRPHNRHLDVYSRPTKCVPYL